MKVKYIGSRPRDVAPVGAATFRVAPGETVDVPDSIGQSLLSQRRLWQEVKEPKPRAEAKRKDGDA